MEAQKIDIPALLGAELPLLDAFYKTWPASLRHRFKTDDEFLRVVIEGHRPLLERWGGWRRHIGPLTSTFIPEEVLRDAIRRVYDERYDAFEADYPRKSLPRPRDNYPLYRAKMFTPETGEKEVEMRYAGNYTCRIRAGQSVPKAVLRAVREQHPDRPEYLRAFERFFEILGQAWSTERASAITISCAPSTFLKFGHYGREVDNGSCFRAGFQSERTKLNLSLLPNSFAALFYTGEHALREGVGPNDGSREKEGAVQCRMYGVMDSEGVLVSNIRGFYSQWSRVLPALTEVFSAELGFPLTVKGSSIDANVRFSIGYWELNSLISSDGNAHVFAREGEHEETFDRLKDAMLAFDPPEAIRDAA